MIIGKYPNIRKLNNTLLNHESKKKSQRTLEMVNVGYQIYRVCDATHSIWSALVPSINWRYPRWGSYKQILVLVIYWRSSQEEWIKEVRRKERSGKEAAKISLAGTHQDLRNTSVTIQLTHLQARGPGLYYSRQSLAAGQVGAKFPDISRQPAPSGRGQLSRGRYLGVPAPRGHGSVPWTKGKTRLVFQNLSSSVE